MLNRQHDREKTKLYQEIHEVNDRLMYLVGRAWNSPPPRAELETQEEEKEVSEWLELT